MSGTSEYHEEMDGSMVRPFILTRGRTRSTSSVHVAMESMVDRKAIDEEDYERLNPVNRQIYDQLSERVSVAEISAHLALPLGVICVLVADMAEQDQLKIHQTASTGDVDLVRRLIDGVRAL